MYKTRECFQLNLTLFPNWFSHIFMAGLMFLVPGLMAERILLSLCIGLVPISFFYYLRAIDVEASSKSDHTFLCLLGFLFAYNYLLHMGFYNFALSLSVFFFTLGIMIIHIASISMPMETALPKSSQCPGVERQWKRDLPLKSPTEHSFR